MLQLHQGFVQWHNEREKGPSPRGIRTRKHLIMMLMVICKQIVKTVQMNFLPNLYEEMKRLASFTAFSFHARFDLIYLDQFVKHVLDS